MCAGVVLTNDIHKNTGEDVKSWYSYSSLGDARIVLKTLRSTSFFIDK